MPKPYRFSSAIAYAAKLPCSNLLQRGHWGVDVLRAVFHALERALRPVVPGVHVDGHGNSSFVFLLWVDLVPHVNHVHARLNSGLPALRENSGRTPLIY